MLGGAVTLTASAAIAEAPSIIPSFKVYPDKIEARFTKTQTKMVANGVAIGVGNKVAGVTGAAIGFGMAHTWAEEAADQGNCLMITRWGIPIPPYIYAVAPVWPTIYEC